METKHNKKSGIQTYQELSDFEYHAKKLLNTSTEDFVVIQIDIDGFKTLNNTYGEEKCDRLLKFIQDFIISAGQYSDGCLYRFIDTFTIILSYTTHNTLIGLIKHWCRKLNTFEDISFRVSVGIYFIEDKSLSMNIMLDHAATARKSVKNNALRCVCTYTPKLQSEVDTVNLIENDMYKALKNKEFVLYLQPKYDIFENKIVGAEALIRWITPEGKMVMPGEFIPIFERNGFVVKTDRFIWREVCKLIKRWKQNGVEIPVSINVSRCNLFDNEFISYLSKLIEKYEIPHELLEIEITESYDQSLSPKIFEKLKQKGFTLLMDDFGSGYSTLNTLHSSDFDVIKLDKEFLSHFMDNARGKQIIRHTISMIQDIGLEVVAEGVETIDQAQFLKNNGCKIVQGFLYSKPLPVNEFEELMERQSNGIEVVSVEDKE